MTIGFPATPGRSPARTFAAADPVAALKQLVDICPVHPGNFWFAAGLSFTSFALIDGVGARLHPRAAPQANRAIGHRFPARDSPPAA